MKFFNVVLSFVALFTAVSAVPTAIPQEDSLEKRATDPVAIISGLITTVKQYTAVINSTAAGVSTSSSQADQNTAGETITAAIASINSAVVDATSQVSNSDISSTDLEGLALLLTELLEEISSALNNIIASLGLTATLSFLGPLVSSLSKLLFALQLVVDKVLALVKELLDGLLGGLSVALSGLVL